MTVGARIWILIHLLWLSAEDIRERQISMPAILELLGSGVLYGSAAGHTPQPVPGAVLLLLGFFSREQIGYGDGWLILALGMWLELPELLGMLFLGFGLLTLWAAAVRKGELPLVPFLTAAYVIGGWL